MHPLYLAAQSWLGTRFRHQGRVKRSAISLGGVDCLGLVMGAAREVGLDIADLDETNYSKIPDGNYLLARLSENLETVFTTGSGFAPHDSMKKIESGDILLFRLDGNPQHLAITDVKDNGKITMIHSYLAAGKVVENHLEEPWISQLVGGFAVH